MLRSKKLPLRSAWGRGWWRGEGVAGGRFTASVFVGKCPPKGWVTGAVAPLVAAAALQACVQLPVSIWSDKGSGCCSEHQPGVLLVVPGLMLRAAMA